MVHHSRGKRHSVSTNLPWQIDNSNDSRLSSLSGGGGNEKVQFSKIGSSKILVVKKKNQQL